MKIIAVDVFVTCPGRNFVTLKITTESGLCGLGDATLNGRELSVASYLKDHLCPQLITAMPAVSKISGNSFIKELTGDVVPSRCLAYFCH